MQPPLFSRLKTHSLLLALVLLALVAGLVPAGAAARPDAPQDWAMYLPQLRGPAVFAATPLAGDFYLTTDIASAADDRLFVVEQAGLVRLRQATGAISTFLDLTDRVVLESAEQGLLALAFDPAYASNGYFYVTYTGSPSGGSDRALFLSRFQVTADPGVADPASEVRLVQIPQASGLHNGGGLAFNPLDGFLYLGVGDDSALLVAQDMGSLKGKIVQVDVQNVAAGAAFGRQQRLGALTAASTQIWAAGLRNPWRFAFDPQNGDLFIGDVGDRAWEEVNFVAAGIQGANFGWPCLEGPDVLLDTGLCANPSQFSLPLVAYPHTQGCTVIGGKVYRRPGQDQRAFIYADACHRDFYALSDGAGQWQVELLGSLSQSTDWITAFGQDETGTLIAGSYGSPAPLYHLFIP